jgi:CHAT domain-containing protein
LPKDPSARVIFIPQESLFLVPFPALRDGDGKYLIQKHTILTAPSILVLDLTHQQGQRLKAEANTSIHPSLVVGNPTMPTVKLEPNQPPQQLPPLLGAQQEAIAIAKLLNTQALIGKDATKAAVLQKMSKARMIHLATHGLLEDFQGIGIPGALALAPPEGRLALPSGGKDSGLLTAGEILDLYARPERAALGIPQSSSSLRAELVVLSACDTGRGRITGDGVIGLSRAFISAGVLSIIVSLWALPDAPTSFLMTEFYQNLQGNPDRATALRSAMLTTMKTYPNPLDWAAFTLIGEAQ